MFSIAKKLKEVPIMKCVFGLLCCAAIAAAVVPPYSGGPYAGGPYARQFEAFKAKYNKVYRNEVEVIKM